MTAFFKEFDMFELRATPDKGIGAFATSSVPAGTSFFKEVPIMTFDKLWCFISGAEVIRKYNRLPPADRTLFDEARHDMKHPSGCGCKKGTAGANSFGDPPHVYPIGSRFNHSCEPNIMMLSPLRGIYQTFRTTRAVALGEELCFSYSTNLEHLSTAQRKVELSKDAYNFECLCSLCQRPAALRQASDMRRTLLRYLHFWLRKKDSCEVQPWPALLKSAPDPKLLKCGVYTLLYAMLGEAEGITPGSDAYLAYAYTVLHILNAAFHNDVQRISPRVVQDMRLWMRKSEDNVLLQYGSAAEGEAGWLAIRQAMSSACVPDNGELNWDNLMVVAERLSNKGMRLFCSVPP